MGEVGCPSNKKFNSMARPALTGELTAEEFAHYYWLKAELIRFCSAHSIPQSGSKQELTNRISYYLQHGKPPATPAKERKIRNGFNWDKDPLTLQTIITDQYKNSRRVREFFCDNIGQHFAFNVMFLQWMRENIGKTLSDAIEAWRKIEQQKKNRQVPNEIAPQFQYNRYMQDFLADNPGLSPKEARHCWNIKRELPGPHKYQKSDLQLLG